MAITVPVAGQEISATTFGAPVANEVNRITPLVVAPTAWVNLTLINSWLAISSMIPQYRKIGDIVYTRGSVSRAGAAGTQIAVLPVGFRPPTGRAIEAATQAYTANWQSAIIDISDQGIMTYGGANPASPNYLPLEFQFSITA